MTRTRILLSAGGAALALAATACGGGGDTGGPVELTFWHGYTEADGDVLEGIVDDFNESQDDVTITTEVKTWASIDDSLLTALSAGEGPDIVAMPAERLPVYADKGAFAELDDFYADESSNTADLVEGAASMVEVEGTKYGVPTGFVPLAVYYNTALFEAAGVTEFPQTWDEWVATAERLTVDEDGDGTPEQYGAVLPDHATVANGLWPSLFYGNGGNIVEDGKAVIDSPENAATLEYWRTAIVDGQISPTGVDGIGADELFSAGKAAMTVGGPWMASIAEENGIGYEIAAIPAGPEAQAASAIGVSMGITVDAGDEAQAAAEEFFAHFLNDENAAAWSLGSGWPPLRTDVPTEAVSANPVVVSLTEMSDLGRPLLPGVVNSVDVLAAVDELTQRAMAGEDVDALLAEAQAEIQAALDE
ncbi:ABC transporter substrate-binding protein [Glycomyces sp. TRM65418]|uniref:ABC transporter substrate-binding protein n=1 Tax=Glycomyces sp. TRM65418 TaxID=2867006 RepID=UPI001CE69B51|nr:ABC transporter substrate-binding protein [Glycomyces sp. TRM65418]MCC3761937.1 ABC transporter substrate-binding protein [Glycomyces sp. TRM65418]QZD56016.1 ABC transporter substrate-binding protein [Glycomyces sp. TRM65418]